MKAPGYQLPFELAHYVEDMPNPKNEIYSYANLLLALKKYNIRPLAIDHEKSNFAYYHNPNNFFGSADRILSLNLYSKEIIESELQNKKYIVLVGSAHGFKTNHGPGLKQLLSNSVSLVASRFISPPRLSQRLLFNYKETRVSQLNKYAGGEILEADMVYACQA